MECTEGFCAVTGFAGNIVKRADYLCALPVPLSEKVSVLASFFEVCFGAPPWGALVVPPVVPKGVVLRHFFSLLGNPILAPFFDSFWAARGREKAVFSM